MNDRGPVAEQIASEIREIMQTYREQEERGSVRTPGGLEHMGDVWRLLSKWDKALRNAEISRSDRVLEDVHSVSTAANDHWSLASIAISMKRIADVLSEHIIKIKESADV